MKTLKRKKQDSIIDALTNAQKFIFAPLAFQALVSMLELGIFEFIDKNSATEDEIIFALGLDEYTVRTLLQIGITNKLIQKDEATYKLTKMGQLFLYDDMTKANFGFVKDVCYLGASELTASFQEQKPKGLQKFIGNYPTIYTALTELPEKMQNSWYEFDHLYSDNCFEEVFQIINRKYKTIYDIGGNTGKFEALCLKHDKNFDITMFDLKSNINKIRNKPELKNCKFHPINVLDEKPNYPNIKNSAVLMSQFLDCFSKKDIIKILTDIRQHMDRGSRLYILEPYTDMQKFEGANYSLLHTSLYFTCMANGISKFYSLEEMKTLIEKAGFTIDCYHQDIGSYNYTLLECENSALGRWFQIKEQSAGENRLRLSLFLYKIFGKNVLYLIAFLMSVFTFIFAPKVKEYSKKYLKVIGTKTGLKPSLINQFKHIHSYANSLVDKFLVYSGNFETNDVKFSDKFAEKQLYEDLDKGNGVFFICNHIGNVEVFQAFFQKLNKKNNIAVDIFVSGKQSQIFNNFLSKTKLTMPITTFQVDDIGLNTGIELKDELNKGNMVFIAGDRVSENNCTKNITTELFGHTILLPKGTFKLVQLMEVPTYYISVIKNKSEYEIVIQKQETLSEKELITSYTQFLEGMIVKVPFQCYQFYDFFN
ncbi:methyltransferase domain-containing protein [bacterium]|nr:methyltransferase domain-containing protein [bacterium]